MSYKDIEINKEIYSTEENPVSTFFIPLLSNAVQYDVAVGYFNSKWFKNCALGISSLVKNNGKSRWIINPELSEKDWSIFDDLSKEEKVLWITNKIDDSLENLFELLEINTREIIAWLISTGTLEFRVAVPKRKLSGIFHPKIGIFTDSEGNKVAFTGSYNHTGGAAYNWEHIEIFKSWEDQDRVSSKVQKFESMWNEKDENLTIYYPSEKSIRKIISYANNSESKDDNIENPCPQIPDYYILRQHQLKAIAAWFKNNGRGIYHMATGSGKTVTALATITKLYSYAIDKGSKLGIVVTVPYKHLADQWEKEANSFGFKPILCYGSYKSWISNAKNILLEFKLNLRDHFFFITSNATFQKNKFQSILDSISGNYIFIADEMHNLGGDKISQVLPGNAKFRLGLSATPDRHYDEKGTELLKEYFGDIVIEYGIKDAIKDKTLCEYYYYPIIINLTAEENEEYKILSKKLGKLYVDEVRNREQIKYILLKRSRLIANADNKIVELRKLIEERADSYYNLVYCGDEIEYDNFDNSIDNIEENFAIRQVDKILKIIGNEIGMKASKFTALEDTKRRKDILSQFAKGELQTLIAIRCLDEGVDVPRTETAYILASTTNPRQFIQRRGRVLRTSKGKKYATIYDFIVIPTDYEVLNDTDYNIERNLIQKELMRVKEFAEISMNEGDTLKIFREIKMKYNLLNL